MRRPHADRAHGDPDWSERAQKPLWSAFTVGLAVLLAVFAARWARHTALDGPLRIALGVVLPVGVAAVVFLSAISPDDLATFVPGLLLWLAGLTLALWAAASLASRDRLRTAWWVGVLGALVAADLAVILAVVDVIAAGGRAGPVSSPTPLGGVDWISSPLWLLAAWTDWNIGLPRPTIHGRSSTSSPTEVLVEPMLYLACTPYALAYTIRAARSAPAEPVALAPTPV